MKRFIEARDKNEVAAVSVTPAGDFVDANEKFCSLIGYPLEKLLPLTYRDVSPEKWLTHENHFLIKHAFQEGHTSYQKEYIHADGHIFPIELDVKLLKDEEDNTIGMWAYVRKLALKEGESIEPLY